MASEEPPAIICWVGLKQLIGIRDRRCTEHRERARVGCGKLGVGNAERQTERQAPIPVMKGGWGGHTINKMQDLGRNRGETAQNTWVDRKGAQWQTPFAVMPNGRQGGHVPARGTARLPWEQRWDGWEYEEAAVSRPWDSFTKQVEGVCKYKSKIQIMHSMWWKCWRVFLKESIFKGIPFNQKLMCVIVPISRAGDRPHMPWSEGNPDWTQRIVICLRSRSYVPGKREPICALNYLFGNNIESLECKSKLSLFAWWFCSFLSNVLGQVTWLTSNPVSQARKVSEWANDLTKSIGV